MYQCKFIKLFFYFYIHITLFLFTTDSKKTRRTKKGRNADSILGDVDDFSMDNFLLPVGDLDGENLGAHQ